MRCWNTPQRTTTICDRLDKRTGLTTRQSSSLSGGEGEQALLRKRKSRFRKGRSGWMDGVEFFNLLRGGNTFLVPSINARTGSQKKPEWRAKSGKPRCENSPLLICQGNARATSRLLS